MCIPITGEAGFIDSHLSERLMNEGHQTHSFCYVDDLVKGIIRMMGYDRFNGPVNLGNPAEATILEFAERIISQTNSTSKIVFKPLPADDPQQRQPDTSLAKKKLGWEPAVYLEMGLQRTINYSATQLLAAVPT